MPCLIIQKSVKHVGKVRNVTGKCASVNPPSNFWVWTGEGPQAIFPRTTDIIGKFKKSLRCRKLFYIKDVKEGQYDQFIKQVSWSQIWRPKQVNSILASIFESFLPLFQPAVFLEPSGIPASYILLIGHSALGFLSPKDCLQAPWGWDGIFFMFIAQDWAESVPHGCSSGLNEACMNGMMWFLLLFLSEKAVWILPV